MKLTKLKIFALMLVLAMVLPVAACSSGGSRVMSGYSPAPRGNSPTPRGNSPTPSGYSPTPEGNNTSNTSPIKEVQIHG